MKEQGFTLVELIGVIVILGLIAAFSVPALTKTMKDSSEKQYENYVKNITLAAENYFHSETDATLNGKYFIKLKTLIDNGYWKKENNPKTNKETDENLTVMISKNGDGTEKYDLLDIDATESGYIHAGLLVHYDGYNKPIDDVWNDLSGNGNNGNLYNFNENASNNNGIQFDGVNDYIKTTQSSNFPSGSSQYTLEITFYYGTLKTRNNLINMGIYNSPGNANGIYIYNSTQISHWYWSNDLRTESILESGRTYTVTALYNGTNRKVYVNGIQKASDSATPNVTIGNITIGDEIPGQDGFFNGKVYSVRIYNRALTDAEINNNYMVDQYRFDV